MFPGLRRPARDVHQSATIPVTLRVEGYDRGSWKRGRSSGACCNSPTRGNFFVILPITSIAGAMEGWGGLVGQVLCIAGVIVSLALSITVMPYVEEHDGPAG